MPRFLAQLAAAIQLTRLTVAFGAVSDLWFVILLTRASDPDAVVASMPLTVALALGALIAIGLYAYGASLNDVLDARHDETFSPDRPIPAGRIRPAQAIIVTVSALLLAILAAAAFGMPALLLALLVAGGILFYNATGKYIPAIGLVVIGIIHAGHMMIPNTDLAFTLPVWLVMTHAAGVTLAVHLFERKRPRIRNRTLWVAGLGWGLASAAILWLGVRRGGFWPAGLPLTQLVWPGLAVVGFVVIARIKTWQAPPARAAEKVRRYGAMWQSLYGAAWLMMLGHQASALGIAIFACLGFATMTVIKEMTGLSQQPIAYR